MIEKLKEPMVSSFWKTSIAEAGKKDKKNFVILGAKTS